MKFSFHNLTIIAISLFLLSGCATYQANVGPTQIRRAQEEIPEELADGILGLVPR